MSLFGYLFGSKSSYDKMTLSQYKAPLYYPTECVSYQNTSYRIEKLICNIGESPQDFDSTITIRSVREILANGGPLERVPPPKKKGVTWKYKLEHLEGYVDERKLDDITFCPEITVTTNQEYARQLKSAATVKPENVLDTIDQAQLAYDKAMAQQAANKYVIPNPYLSQTASRYGGTRKIRKRKTLRKKARSLK